MKKKIFTLVAASIFLSTMMVVAQKNINVTVKKTGSKKGAVTFNHRKHKKHAIDVKKCKTCHHIGRYHQSCGEKGCHDDPKKDD